MNNDGVTSHPLFTRLLAPGLFFILIITTPASARVYKWVDEDGNVQFSQNPPPGVESDVVEPKYSKGSTQAQQDLQDRVEGFRKRADQRQKNADEKQQQAEEKAAKKQRCDNARRRLASYSRPRVNKVSEDGQRVRIGEEQRQAELAKAREYLAEHCQ